MAIYRLFVTLRPILAYGAHLILSSLFPGAYFFKHDFRYFKITAEFSIKMLNNYVLIFLTGVIINYILETFSEKISSRFYTYTISAMILIYFYR